MWKKVSLVSKLPQFRSPNKIVILLLTSAIIFVPPSLRQTPITTTLRADQEAGESCRAYVFSKKVQKIPYKIYLLYKCLQNMI